MRSSDVVVIGGGLLGSACAYELAILGLKVCVVDRLDHGQATAAGAGILSPATSRWGEDEDVPFLHDARAYYDRLIGALEIEGERETGFGHLGVLVVAGVDDPLVEFHRLQAHLLRRASLAGVSGPAEITGVEARQRFPALGETSGVLADDSGARVDGRKLSASLQRAGTRLGCEFIRDGVDRVWLESGRVVGVGIRGERIATERVVLAAGAWLAGVATQVGIPPCVEPMRGQICHLRLPGVQTDGWTVVSGMRGHYLLPWPSGRVVVGATRERGSGISTDLTVAGCANVLQEALRLAPGLGTATVEEWRVGLRPVSVDERPIIGPVPSAEGCYALTGHGASGLLLGPWSAHLAAAEIAGSPVDARLNRYRTTRLY